MANFAARIHILYIMSKKVIITVLTIAAMAVVFLGIRGCKSMGSAQDGTAEAEIDSAVGPQFNADSAFMFVKEQCDFGPRTMNSTAHDKCARWIIDKFQQYGCKVRSQKVALKGYDGTMLNNHNIMASYRPELTTRIMLCAHWDSRPWADNDPDSANWHMPVMAANDGASGIAVMIEIARLLQNDTTLGIGVDFVCLDAEDWGVPQWADVEDDGNSWALGSQYFSANLPEGYEARFGILLDMVGGQGARFYREGLSKEYAPQVVEKVWRAARSVGYGSMFPEADGGMITDDHVPLNRVAKIPTIDVIPYYPDCSQSSFGPTWHTISDDVQHIDPATLKAVGQTMIQVIYSEK